MRLHTSFVLGYHGCDKTIGENVLAGKATLTASNKDYDWLGPETYFWEADPLRAWEWADEKAARGEINDPFVVGAIIDLGHCLDLMSRNTLEALRGAYDLFVDMRQQAGDGREMPANKGRDGDKLLRYLDCAVIRTLHQVLSEQRKPAFDSVRGLFSEGGELFPGSGFHRKTHVQLAIRNETSIKGSFRVPRPD